jgi:leader peptidase (prepilin peptidase)/N-methyltransferase
LTATLAAVACAGLAWRFGAAPVLVPFLALVPLGCLLGAIDLACLRLPEQLVLPGIGGSVVAFGVLALVTGGWGGWLRAVLAGLALGGAYLVLALLPGGQLGGGDVTLAALLGLYLGWLGWPIVVAGALLPFALNAPVAVGLLVARRVGRRSELPFGPAMLAGAYVAVVGPRVLAELLNR